MTKFKPTTTFRTDSSISAEVRTFVSELSAFYRDGDLVWMEGNLIHFVNDTMAFLCEVEFSPHLILIQRQDS